MYLWGSPRRRGYSTLEVRHSSSCRTSSVGYARCNGECEDDLACQMTTELKSTVRKSAVCRYCLRSLPPFWCTCHALLNLRLTGQQGRRIESTLAAERPRGRSMAMLSSAQ
eukprot:683567-Hanusia_phi.AAC.1